MGRVRLRTQRRRRFVVGSLTLLLLAVGFSAFAARRIPPGPFDPVAGASVFLGHGW